MKIKSVEESIEHSIKTYIGESSSSIRDKVAELDDYNTEIKKFKWIARKWNELDDLRLSVSKLTKAKNSLDKKIELVDFQLERNKEFKKGLLQQMFV